jgi:hypothetical protein
LYPAKEG